MQRSLKESAAPWLLWPETKALTKAFGGNPLRFVGGAVRDSMLSRPVKDVDIATPLLPEQAMELLKQSGIKTIPTGIDHGTITAVIGKRHFEITTLRRDVVTDGRRAVVAYTEDWREDAMRRDFTLNALYCDAQGVITDYFGGYEDALQGAIRFIGDAGERIREDALRILRFFRFYAVYGKGDVDRQALNACAALAAKIETLSGERIQQEMLKILASDNAAPVISLMQEAGVLQYVIPVKVSVESLARYGAEKDPVVALALLLRSNKGNVLPVAEKIAVRWKLSKTQARLLSDVCAGSLGGKNEKEWKKQIRSQGKELFIHHATTALAENQLNADAAAVTVARTWNIPEFPVSGDDLLSKGIKADKEMGVILKKLEAYWEEKDYMPDKTELLKRIADLHN